MNTPAAGEPSLRREGCPAARESAIESFEDPFAAKGETGIGFLRRGKGGKGR